MLLDTGTPVSSLVRGCLDEIRGDTLHGWLFSSLSQAKPLVFVDDTPAALVGEGLLRPDVCEALSIPDNTGFLFRLPAVGKESVLSLYAATPDGVFLVERKKSGIPVCEQAFLSQVEQAANVASQPGAVAVVCWDGAHNPVGRAKVLHDVVATKRPVVLFCYLHKEFGGTLWYPLLNSEIVIVTIPWEQRQACHRLIRRSHIAFDTVWIAKNRLPSFRLAAAISHRNTRFVLDIDDDEEAFIASQSGSRASYNGLGLNLARELTASIASRTVVSPTLQKRFGGILVRHARAVRTLQKKSSTGVYKLAFVGTVRPHKKVLAIAKAVNLIKFTTGLPLEFHVYGDIQPPEYREDLAAYGVIMRDMLPECHLPAVLAEMQAVITGFPSPCTDKNALAIVEAQVSAKIADALALGLPVLTPDTPAIADLHGSSGVYPFTTETFKEQLLSALKQTENVALPQDFTLDGAYGAFECAEDKAIPSFELASLLPEEPSPGISAQPALVLLWKQQDAGLYGRRIDQIARSYKRKYPEHRVFLLETYFSEKDKFDTEDLIDEIDDFADEKESKDTLLKEKKYGLKRDGLFFKTFWYSEPDELRSDFFSFLTQNVLHPDNTVFVLFPIIQDLRLIADMLKPYRTVIDIVDNQLSWATNDERRCFVFEQYFRLIAPASCVVFNAESVRAFFASKHFLNMGSNIQVIPNWYTLPEGIIPCHQPVPGKIKHIFYSGNMNDRLDWELLHAIAKLPNIRLHLAGRAVRAVEDLEKLLTHASVIYHGMTQESETVALLQSMDACIVPHLLDDVSVFMNPIKIRMYQAVGLPIFCPVNLSLSGQGIFLYTDEKDCLKKIGSLRKEKWPPVKHDQEDLRSYQELTENTYMHLLESLFIR